MNILNFIFSFLCNQAPARCFHIAGHLMPLCQRCTGLYIGMGFTFIWFLLSRNYNRGLPPRRIVYVNVICLLVMPVFGFHLLDPGPAWRLWSGLIYGNAIVFLFFPAALMICNKDRGFNHYKKFSTNSFWVFFVLLNSVPLWFPIHSAWLFYVTIFVILTGILGIVIVISIVFFNLIRKLVKSVIMKGFCYERSK